MAGVRIFYACKGLPASGKTSWARDIVLDNEPGKAVRVNRDLLRTMLHFDRFGGRSTEATTEWARDRVIELAMWNQYVDIIICDDTNLDPSVMSRLRALVERGGFEFRVQDFTDVPIEVCIARDANRVGKAKVGADVIRGMAERWLAA